MERDHQRVGCELPGQTMETDITPEQIGRTLNIRTIYEFVETMDRRQDDFSAARNFSFSKANGEYILWLDADDVVPRRSLELLMETKKQMVQFIGRF